jgi:hypothetical protein
MKIIYYLLCMLLGFFLSQIAHGIGSFCDEVHMARVENEKLKHEVAFAQLVIPNRPDTVALSSAIGKFLNSKGRSVWFRMRGDGSVMEYFYPLKDLNELMIPPEEIKAKVEN